MGTSVLLRFPFFIFQPFSDGGESSSRKLSRKPFAATRSFTWLLTELKLFIAILERATSAKKQPDTRQSDRHRISIKMDKFLIYFHKLTAIISRETGRGLHIHARKAQFGIAGRSPTKGSTIRTSNTTRWSNRTTSRADLCWEPIMDKFFLILLA
jgi:hypothetical protein